METYTWIPWTSKHGEVCSVEKECPKKVVAKWTGYPTFACADCLRENELPAARECRRPNKVQILLDIHAILKGTLTLNMVRDILKSDRSSA